MNSGREMNKYYHLHNEERKFHLTNYIARLQIIKGLSRTIHEIKAISHKKSDFLFTLYENLS